MSNSLSPTLRFNGHTDAWRRYKLSELTTMHARIGWQNLRTSEFLDDGDYMLITGTDFENGRINYDTCHYVAKERYDQDKNIQIQNGSILITKDGTLGKVAFVQGLKKPATLNAGVFNVTVSDTDLADKRYLFHYLKAPFLMSYVNQRATGGTIKHLNQSILVDFPVVAPQKNEQEEIGKLLMELDETISLYEDKRKKLTKIKLSLTERIFPNSNNLAPVVDFNGSPSNWTRCELRRICNIVKGKQLGKNEMLPRGKYYVLNGGIYPSGFTNNYNVNANTISISEGGNSCGYVCLNKHRFWSGGHNYTLQNPKIDTRYLYQFLKHKENAIMALRVGSGLPNIQKNRLEELEISFPDKERQAEIGNTLQNIDALLYFYRRKLIKLNNIKSSLLSKMFVEVEA